MKMIEHTQTIPKTELPCGDIALDIETEGLTRDRDAVFLVGVLLGGEEFDTLTQWILPAPEPAAERELLECVAARIAGHSLLTFNGEAFDLPFLAHRAQKRGVLWPEIISRDLYAQLRRIRKFLALPNLKLKTVEHELGISRKDELSGAQVAQLYRHADRPDILEKLLLHNREDVLYTARLLAYFERVEADMSFSHERNGDELHFRLIRYDGRKDFAYLTFQIRSATELRLAYEDQFSRIQRNGDEVEIRLPRHVGSWNGEQLDVTVCPDAAGDFSPYGLRTPLLCLADKKRCYTKNLIQAARSAVRRAFST